MTEAERLTVAQAAARVGVVSSTWRAYVTRGQAPKPDGHYDARTPWWLVETVDAWKASRGRSKPVPGVRRSRVAQPTVPVR